MTATARDFNALADDLERRLERLDRIVNDLIEVERRYSAPPAQHSPCPTCNGSGGYTRDDDGNGCKSCAGTGWADYALVLGKDD